MELPKSKIKIRHFVFFLLVLFLSQYVARPGVNVRFSDRGKGNFDYIWNVEHSIYKGELLPGGVTGDTGHIFPGPDFFMRFDWKRGEEGECVEITPNWPTVNLYIGSDGLLDGSKTDMGYVRTCT